MAQPVSIRTNHAEHGMSLLELLCLLAILAIVASLAAPMLRGPGDRVSLENTAREIVQTALRTRAEAIGQGTIAHMDVDLKERIVRRGSVEEVQRLSADLGIEAQAVHHPDTDRETARILFYPNGQSSGGRLTLRKDDQSIRIEINWVTGHVSYHHAS